MIVFQKDSSGWQNTGDQLPTETTVTIAVDANKPERMTYRFADAIQEVENRIKQGTTAYRFEIAGAPARLQRKPQPVQATKAPAKPKSTPKPKGKKETGKQRHARLKAEGICTACGKRKPAPRPKAKGGGRYNECAACRAYYKKWESKKQGA